MISIDFFSGGFFFVDSDGLQKKDEKARMNSADDVDDVFSISMESLLHHKLCVLGCRPK